MNSLMQQMGGILKSTQDLRRQMLSVLTDEDLAFRLPGDNTTLGELCQEMGEVQHAYIQGFKTRQQDFSYRHDDAAVTTSVAALGAWYDALDAELVAALEALSEDDLQKPVDRGHGFAPPVMTNFHVYREALLIFYAKADVYIKALGKHVPGMWAWWIGNRADWERAAEYGG